MPLEEYRLSADEIACVKKLAERYERGEHYVMMTRPDAHGGFVDPLDLPVEKRVAILGVMEGMGLIFDPRHVGELRFHSFKIASKAIQAARTIHEQETKKEEPRDIVDYVKNSVRRNTILGWGLIAFFVLVGLSSVVTLINGLVQLLKTLGVVK